MPNLSSQLPADCRIKTLALWIDAIDIGDYVSMARKVRALLEDVARRTVAMADVDDETCHVTVDDVVTAVLGRP